MYVGGFDIGGTKCAVVTAESKEGNITFLKRRPVSDAVRAEMKASCPCLTKSFQSFNAACLRFH